MRAYGQHRTSCHKTACTSLVFCFGSPLSCLLLLLLVLFVVRLHVVFLLLLFLQAFLFCPSLLRGMLFNKFHFMRPVSEQHSSQFASPRCPPPATLSAKIYLQLVLFVLGDANFKIRFCYSNGERNNKLQNETSKNSVDYELQWGS